jgi:hypothetical protein
VAGVVKVLDFGLASLTAERGEGGLTEANVIMGTPEYMAPEQAADARTADVRADVYSLGCTLFHLLTGRVPYPAPTALLKVVAHRERPVPSAREGRPEVSAGLEAVLARMLAKRPEGRYQTPGEVAEALAPFTSPAQSPRKRRPHLVALALAALLAGSVLAGIVVYRIQTDKGELVITTESEDVDVVVRKGGKVVWIIDTKTKKSIRLDSGTYELELKGAPEGLKLSIDRATVRRGETVLARIERVLPVPTKPAPIKVGEVFRKRSDGTVHYGVDLSPDGRLLLSNRENGHRRVWDVPSGKIVHELEGWIAHFTPDGKKIVTEFDQELRLYDTDSGKLLRQFGRHPKAAINLTISPNGRTASVGCRDGQFWVYDLTTGKRVAVSFGGRWQETWGRKDVPEFQKRTGIVPDYVLPNGREVMGRHLLEGKAFGIYDIRTGRLVRKVPLRGARPGWQEGREYFTAATYGFRHGNRMAVSIPDNTVCVLDLLSGKEVTRFSVGNFEPKCLAISADDRFVAVCARHEPSDLVVWRLPDPPAAKGKP